jgi:hypothetical protein
MLNDVDRISSGYAHRLCLLMEENPEHRTDIVLGFAKMGNLYFGLERRVELALDHFDFAVSLGTCAPFDVIERALGNFDDTDLSNEQHRSLIRLENSRWTNTRKAGTTEQPLHHYEAFVTRVVLDRPQDTDRIIALAQSGSCGNMLQMNAVLDGEVIAALSEGML